MNTDGKDRKDAKDDRLQADRRLLEIEWVKERLRNSGSPKAMKERSERRRRIQRRIWDEKEALIGKHPRKWVVMGENGILTLGDSLKEVIAEARSRGIDSDDMVVEYLDPNPRPLMTPYHLLPGSSWSNDRR